MLVVDDEAPIRRVVRLYLTREGFAVIEAGDGESGLRLALEHQPDIVVLDLLPPGRDGWSVCRELVSRTSVPILILNARDDEADAVLGLDLGADDYLTKPFRAAELVARIKALQRRADRRRKVPEASERLDLLDFAIDRRRRELTVRGQPAPCPGKEFDLLWLLASNPHRVFSVIEGFNAQLRSHVQAHRGLHGLLPLIVFRHNVRRFPRGLHRGQAPSVALGSLPDDQRSWTQQLRDFPPPDAQQPSPRAATAATAGLPTPLTQTAA